MASTYNRRPRFVDTPTSKAIATSYFHQNEWKGICEDKNTFGVDQNTFSECENVYVNRDNVLCNRPCTIKVDLTLSDDYKTFESKEHMFFIKFSADSPSIYMVSENDNKEVIVNSVSINDEKFKQETNIYIYELGNILFFFGIYSIYKLEGLTLVSALENIYTPDVTDIRNYLCPNSYTIKLENQSYSDVIDTVIANPTAYSVPGLQIKSKNTLSSNVVETNWPYNVENIEKSVYKNVVQLTDRPKHVYYIGTDIYTNGGSQKDVEINVINSNTQFELKLYFYDTDGSMVHSGQDTYTYRTVLSPTLSAGDSIYNSYFKVDYYKSKNGILYIAISMSINTSSSDNYSKYLFSSIDVSQGLTSISISNVEENLSDSGSIKYVVPFCFYYDENDLLKSVGFSYSSYGERKTLYWIFDSPNYYEFYTLTTIRQHIIPTSVSNSDAEYLLTTEYVGKYFTNQFITFVNDVSPVDVIRIDYVGTVSLVDQSDVEIINSSILTGLEIYQSTKVKLYTLSNTNIEEQILSIVDGQISIEVSHDVYSSVYPSVRNAFYEDYSTMYTYSDADEPFGTIVIPIGESITDVYYDEVNDVNILLTSGGKLFTTVGNDSDITYDFLYSVDPSYSVEHYPTIIKPVGNNSFLYFFEDTSYILQVRYNNSVLQMYIPVNKINRYYDTVIDAEQSSDKSVLVIGNNVLYNVVDSEQLDDNKLPIFYYIQSKLNLNVIHNCDNIIAYNSSTILMLTYNGIAAVDYSQLISTEEQTVKYITDNILTHWFKYIKDNSVIRTCNHNYYLMVYNTSRSDLYVFDYRSNSWWYWTFEKNVKVIQTLGLNCCIVFDDNSCYYFSETKLSEIETTYVDAPWKVVSQKLFLGNNTNYKQIRRFTVHTIGEHSEFPSKELADNIMDLRFYCYRKRMHSIQELEDRDDVYNFNVDFVRTYVIRVNYPKVYEFQYRLSSNPITLRPLQLTGITIEYKVGGKVR